MEKDTKTVVVTRAAKKDATKQIIKELLAKKEYRHNDLIDEAAKLYIERFENGEIENVNDVKGRIGSVLDIMKKEQETRYEGGVYALIATQPVEEKPAKKASKKASKAKTEAKTEEIAEEKQPKKTTRKKTTKAKTEEIAPTVEATVEKTETVATEKAEEKVETPKKRGRKKTVKEPVVQKVEPEEEQPNAKEEPLKEEQNEAPKADEEKALVVKEKAEVAPKNVVMDMSFLFGETKNKPQKTATDKQEKTEKPVEATEKIAPVVEEKVEKAVVKTEKPLPPVKAEQQPKTEKKAEQVQNKRRLRVEKTVTKPLTAEEKLKESFLKRIRSLGGDYFEYYSVYLLEKYSRKNGRRLEGLKISGGEHDGGIDGEIELTDRLGFRETIYIQAKNWNPEKGDEKLWVVGETLLQQFIGACACRQAKDGKQHCRGIFITTSRFTPEAKRVLSDMSDKIVGYDGTDLFEAAKECEFGLIKRGNDWVLDEKLLSGTKAFFNML